MKTCDSCKLLLDDSSDTCPICYGSVNSILYNDFSKILYSQNKYKKYTEHEKDLDNELSEKYFKLERRFNEERKIEANNLPKDNINIVESEKKIDRIAQVSIEKDKNYCEKSGKIFFDIPKSGDLKAVLSNTQYDNTNKNEIYYNEGMSLKEPVKPHLPKAINMRLFIIIAVILVTVILGLLVVINWEAITVWLTTLIQKIIIFMIIIGLMIYLISRMVLGRFRRR